MSIIEKIKGEPIKSSEQLFKEIDSIMKGDDVWIFRGQKGKDKKEKKNENLLETSLEKALSSFDHEREDAPSIEKGLLRKFKRHAALYLENVPVFDNYMEWFALMQHYGAPTRLQDWTYSPYSAVYMAINDMKRNAEVWSINTTYIEKSAIKLIRQKSTFKKKKDKDIKEIMSNDSCTFIPENFKKLFIEKPISFVLPMNPYYLNERLTIQQGLFLCPGDISKSFDDNLSAHFKKDDLKKENIRIFKFENNADLKKEILQRLYRMNMNNAVLFPGLDGFAKSLRTLLAFPYSQKKPGMLRDDIDLVKKHFSRMNK